MLIFRLRDSIKLVEKLWRTLCMARWNFYLMYHCSDRTIGVVKRARWNLVNYRLPPLYKVSESGCAFSQFLRLYILRYQPCVSLLYVIVFCYWYWILYSFVLNKSLIQCLKLALLNSLVAVNRPSNPSQLQITNRSFYHEPPSSWIPSLSVIIFCITPFHFSNSFTKKRKLICLILLFRLSLYLT